MAKLTYEIVANESQSDIVLYLIELEVDSPLTVGLLVGLGETQKMSGIISLDGEFDMTPVSTDSADVILFGWLVPCPS